jgi:hypothetical protein
VLRGMILRGRILRAWSAGCGSAALCALCALALGDRSAALCALCALALVRSPSLDAARFRGHGARWTGSKRGRKLVQVLPPAVLAPHQ